MAETILSMKYAGPLAITDSDVLTQVRTAVNEIVAFYKTVAADGQVTFVEMFTLASKAVGSLVQVVEGIAGLTSAQRKAAVLAGIAQLYDEVIAPMDLKGIPNFLEGAVDTAIRQVLLLVADGWIDTLVSIFNRTGWGMTPGPGTPVTPAVPGTPPTGGTPVTPPSGFVPY